MTRFPTHQLILTMAVNGLKSPTGGRDQLIRLKMRSNISLPARNTPHQHRPAQMESHVEHYIVSQWNRETAILISNKASTDKITLRRLRRSLHTGNGNDCSRRYKDNKNILANACAFSFMKQTLFGHKQTERFRNNNNITLHTVIKRKAKLKKNKN